MWGLRAKGGIRLSYSCFVSPGFTVSLSIQAHFLEGS